NRRAPDSWRRFTLRQDFPLVVRLERLNPVTSLEFYKLHQHFISTHEMMLISRETVVSRLPKFMQTLDDIIYRELEKIAKRRGITIQDRKSTRLNSSHQI